MKTQDKYSHQQNHLTKSKILRPYSAPALAVYGAVGYLTKGSGGTKTDGNMNNQM